MLCCQGAGGAVVAVGTVEDPNVELVGPVIVVVTTVGFVVPLMAFVGLVVTPEAVDVVVTCNPAVGADPGEAVGVTLGVVVAPMAITEVRGRSVTSAPAALTAT